MGLPSNATSPAIIAEDYNEARTELFSQISLELQVRHDFAVWESEHRPRETDWRLDPARTLEEQALAIVLPPPKADRRIAVITTRLGA